MIQGDAILGLDVNIFYLLVLLAIITVIFVFFKRPIYEAMFAGYVGTIVITGHFDLFFKYLIEPSTNTLFYAMVAFLLLAHIFGETKVIDDVIDIILSLIGRIKGGAGYVCLFASAFMASLSGSGPGNVAATGVFTIPIMIRTKFPRAVAASIAMSASSLGPMVPPSGTILLALGVLGFFKPDVIQSKFLIIVWGISIWFVLQRMITLIVMTFIYKVEPMSVEEVPKFKETFKKGWKSLFVPVIIFLPLIIDAKYSYLLTDRIGIEGVRLFSKSILLFTPGLAFLYSIYLAKERIKKKHNTNLAIGSFNLLKTSFKGVVPVAATIYFAYSIGSIYNDLGMSSSVSDWIVDFGFSKTSLIIFIVLFTTFLGMVLPGSTQIAIFGTSFVFLFISAGVNPILAAAILPAITGALEGITPPLALSMYAAMGISKSGFLETSKLAFVWVILHIITIFAVLFGLLPIYGLN